MLARSKKGCQVDKSESSLGLCVSDKGEILS